METQRGQRAFSAGERRKRKKRKKKRKRNRKKKSSGSCEWSESYIFT